MTINGKIGEFTRDDERARAGEPHIIQTGKVAAAQGELPIGLICTKNAAGELIPYEEVLAEALGTGEAAATAVANEVLGAGDGSQTFFSGLLANDDVTPGSVTITATVGAAAKTMTDDGAGVLAGAAGAGRIDYATGFFTLEFAAAPDNATNVTAGYSHTPPARVFSGTLTKLPVEPGSVVVTDGVEQFTDDGLGRLTGDAGGSGAVNYATGAISVAFAAAPAENDAVSASYVTAIAGVLDEPVDTLASGSALYVVFGLVRQDVLKVGALAPAEPDTTLLARLANHGIYAS